MYNINDFNNISIVIVRLTAFIEFESVDTCSNRGPANRRYRLVETCTDKNSRLEATYS